MYEKKQTSNSKGFSPQDSLVHCFFPLCSAELNGAAFVVCIRWKLQTRHCWSAFIKKWHQRWLVSWQWVQTAQIPPCKIFVQATPNSVWCFLLGWTFPFKHLSSINMMPAMQQILMLFCCCIRSQVWLAGLNCCLQSSSWLRSWHIPGQLAGTTP